MSTQAYAASLLRQAQRVLEVVPEPAQALTALDAFLALPGAQTYLAATRALTAARRRHATEVLAAHHDNRLFDRGLEAIRALPGAGPAHADLLAELPRDGRTGHRLVALAQLIEAHLELTGRASAAFREIRRKLAALPTPTRTTWRDEQG
jgi:hypothetical protein